MATYMELFNLRNDDTLRAKLAAAVAVKADEIRVDEAATAAQKAWAREAFSDPIAKADGMIWAVLAANRSVTAQQIAEASDAAVLNAVAAALPIFTG